MKITTNRLTSEQKSLIIIVVAVVVVSLLLLLLINPLLLLPLALFRCCRFAARFGFQKGIRWIPRNTL